MASALSHGAPGPAAAAAHAYRPEIDGLRAIAVVSVIVFHLSEAWLPGGFVGVDVFFVISGYLITGFVRRELASGSWSYPSFFVRRVRRLAPPLLFMTGCACVAAYLLLLPSHMASFAESVIAQPVALQNMHFLAEGQYFHGSGTKPLLHTWSLGVEEQFYFVWPFAIVVASRFSRRKAMAIIVVLLALSFALNLALPIVSPKASFFLFPARAWELGIGGLLSIAEERRGPAASSPSWRRDGVIGASLLILLGSFVWIDSTMAFPGWVAAVPVISTAAIIAACSRGESRFKRLLELRPLVFIGLISYSLYLWHWPLIAFTRHLHVELNGSVVAALVILSVAGAVLSYRFVEQPVRRRRAFASTRSLLAGSFSVGVVLMALGVLALRTDGLAFRYSEPARSMLVAPLRTAGDDRCGFVFRVLHPNAQVCELDDAAEPASGGVLLWGNSHAGMWVGLLTDLAEAAGRPLYLNARNCRATTDSTFCGPAVQQAVLTFAESNGVSDVVLAATWYGSYDIPDAEFEADLTALIGELAARRMRIWLVVDVPVAEAFAPERRYLEAPFSPTFGSISLATHDRTRHRTLDLFERLAAEFPRVRIVDPTEDFCWDGHRCYGGRDGQPYYRDAEHITRVGAEAAHSRFAPIFEGHH